MDELVIEDKKYVSSKRAAKLTGYAKDYVGQLCREGRVPARLVGRSWYVLESAIHDHRFAEKEPESAPAPSAAVFSATWGTPKYEAAPAAVLSVASKEEESVSVPVSPPESMSERLEQSWKAWFERVGEPVSDEEMAEEAPAEEVSAPVIEEEPIQVPIRAIHHASYQPLPHEFMPRQAEIYEEPKREEAYGEEVYAAGGGGLRVSIQLAGVLLSFLMIGLAVAGSGYFDKYILTTEHFGSLAGVGFYNR